MLALFAGHASAANPVIDSSSQDLWFTFTEPAVFTARTYAIQGFTSDPMLWLYDDQNVLLAANDDWFGLQSFLEVPVQVGSYRLRAGWCCNDPDAVRTGWRYELSTSVDAVPTTVETSTTLQESTSTVVETSTTQETSTTTTTTVPESTTTQETTTTIQNVVPSTTDLVPSSSVLPTTSQPPTTLQESTTTSVEPSSTTLPESTTTTVVIETLPSTTVQEVTTTTLNVTTTLTTLPPKPQATTPPQTSTTAPTSPPVTSTSVTPLTTAPPEILETTTTTQAPGETLPNILTNPDMITDAVAQADTPAERAILTATLNASTDEVKRTFEQQVNVYSGQWDSYVPSGSRIPVGERRTLIAVMGGLVSLLSTAPRRKN